MLFLLYPRERAHDAKELKAALVLDTALLKRNSCSCYESSTCWQWFYCRRHCWNTELYTKFLVMSLSRSLSYDRFVASSKVSSPKRAI